MPGVKTLLAIAVSFLCAGCPNTNLDTTPRPVPKGHVVHTLAIQAFRGAGTGVSEAPVYGLRTGVASRADLGFRISPTALAADLKWNFIRSTRFDLALVLGGQALRAPARPSKGTAYLDAPLLAGINLSHELSIVPAVGLSYGFGSQPEPESAEVFGPTRVNPPRPPDAGGWLLRFGAGLDVRFTERFAIQPELTMVRVLDPEAEAAHFYVAGLGFNFGALPNYSDVP